MYNEIISYATKNLIINIKLIIFLTYQGNKT